MTKRTGNPGSTLPQREVFEAIYAQDDARWAFHDDPDPLARYLRDRRLSIALEQLASATLVEPRTWRVLVTFGGVGGEATYLLNRGFADVTVADLSANALEVCRRREPRAKTLELDAEDMALAAGAYDVVLVQDGLHHLPRPALGLAEMLRVARRAVVVIEPYDGLVGRVLGTTWEEHDGERNYVYRWTARSFEQTVRSYLLSDGPTVCVRRLWDHNLAISRMARPFSDDERGLRVAKGIYSALSPFDRLGNMMIAVVVKNP